jgi:hypothetical protein
MATESVTNKHASIPLKLKCHCYKTFYDRNLQMAPVIKSVWVWQAFGA